MRKGVVMVLALLAAGCAPRPGVEAISPVRTMACASAPTPNAEVATKIAAFAATLSIEERANFFLPFSRANAVRWSNLPVNAVPRVGLRLGDLSPAQQSAARAAIAAATSRCGLRMLDEIRAADDYIAPIIPMFGWASANYYIAVLGAPASGSAWMLKVGGHHLAYNFTFDSKQPGATPLFTGAEPIRFTHQGMTYEPLASQSKAMAAVAEAIAQTPGARLEGRFTDVVKGVEVTLYPDRPPVGGNDTGFPSPYPTGAQGRGVAYAALSAKQQQRVREAISAYGELPGEALSRPLLKAYQSPEALEETFVGFSGSPDLSTDGSYVRIDGPRLWMEFVV